MIVKIIPRGRSFKGLTAYLMHDKDGAKTSERVAWHETGNLHTDDPDRAAKYMAWVDTNRETLKEESGAARGGKPADAGGVYHYSLAWAPGETPSAEHQKEQVYATLERLGLSKHQYVAVAHNDEPHQHVHVMVNLTDHETGKRASLKFDKNVAQEWALEYEHQYGMHCHQREENAQRRARGEHTKYQDEKQDYASKVREAYEQADSGRAFVAALEDQGLTVAQGRRGAFVIVDRDGDIQKLSRQIEGVKTKELKGRLADVDFASLPVAEKVSKLRLQGGQQDAVAHQVKEAPAVEQSTPSAAIKQAPLVRGDATPAPPQKVLRIDLDGDRADKIANVKAFYRLDEHRKSYEDARANAERKTGFWHWLTGQKRAAHEQAEALRLNLQNAEWRLTEAIRGVDERRSEWLKQRELDRQGLNKDPAHAQQMEREQREASKHARGDGAGPEQATRDERKARAAKISRDEERTYDSPGGDPEKQRILAQFREAFERQQTPQPSRDAKPLVDGGQPGESPSAEREEKRLSERDAGAVQAEKEQILQQFRERFEQAPEQDQNPSRRLERE